MTHLDAEFKKQNSESLKTLITNQVKCQRPILWSWLTFLKFQGTQVYGTICQSCKYRSETRSEFLEIEVSFKVNTSSMSISLSTQTATEQRQTRGLHFHVSSAGDSIWREPVRTDLLNQPLALLMFKIRYLCSGCRSLQNATRYTELRKLPPVLHFSLMRFVYDLNTMERKKSKHSISFPLSVDMNKFLGSPQTRRHATSTTSDDNIYELRGILLHKGASAYHGHYEAQVFDAQ